MNIKYCVLLALDKTYIPTNLELLGLIGNVINPTN